MIKINMYRITTPKIIMLCGLVFDFLTSTRHHGSFQYSQKIVLFPNQIVLLHHILIFHDRNFKSGKILEEKYIKFYLETTFSKKYFDQHLGDVLISKNILISIRITSFKWGYILIPGDQVNVIKNNNVVSYNRN